MSTDSSEPGSPTEAEKEPLRAVLARYSSLCTIPSYPVPPDIRQRTRARIEAHGLEDGKPGSESEP